MRQMLGIAITILGLCVLKFYTIQDHAGRVPSNFSVEYFDDTEYLRRAERAIIKPTKVFLIGFSKCGTKTISDFFAVNAIPAIHHDLGRLASTMHNNALQGKKLLDERYERYTLFADMEKIYTYPIISIPMLYFKELDKQYPGSKFILNTRNKEAWLKSRSLHRATQQNLTLLELNSNMLYISHAAVLAKWSQEWDAHHKAVLAYFKRRPKDLLVFNIEQDPPEKLCEFFKGYFILDPKFYVHRNKTVVTE